MFTSDQVRTENKEKDSGNMEGAPAKGTSERELLTSLATPQASL